MLDHQVNVGHNVTVALYADLGRLVAQSVLDGEVDRTACCASTLRSTAQHSTEEDSDVTRAEVVLLLTKAAAQESRSPGFGTDPDYTYPASA